MASTGSVYPFMHIKDKRGQVMVVGRLKIGTQAVLEARDFGLRRFHASPQITPNFGDRFGHVAAGSIGSQATIRYDRSFVVVAGSLGSGGSLNNYTKVRALYARTQGSLTTHAGYKGTFGLYLGTLSGTSNYSFVAWGQ